MEISFSSTFKKAFKKRINSKISESMFWERIEIFISDPYDARLKTHKLSGKLSDLWSFTVAYDLRIIFYFTKDKPKKAVFVDIGNHDEVY